MFACFDAKYHYLFWRPVHAITRAATDGNPATDPDPAWTALLTVNHPEYPSGHACFTTTMAAAVTSFFGTSRVRLSFASAITGTHRGYATVGEIVREVREARILSGLHYRHSMLDGELLARRVARHVAGRYFQRGGQS
jgi:PAP2 superfamily